eukprot:TRINITY_DN16881_c0_g1_i1.p1 TRINITY_DN16881_c0_g1~~TRINITY_DN16881_c0_g1_i1.p1  ORF type:complete len:287 (-),score=1.96 TRINITY_DN16881_c0_g1_i1:420-1280(-)
MLALLTRLVFYVHSPRVLHGRLMVDGRTNGWMDEAPVEAMDAHRGSAEVQAKGCRVLEHMVSNAETRPRVVVGGGIKSVVAAMNAQRRSNEVQQWACLALKSITSAGATSQLLALRSFSTEEIREKVVGCGGVEALVAAIHEHLGDRLVLERACSALADLATTAATRQRVVDCGGVEALVAAMHAVRNIDSVYNEDCRAIDKEGCRAIDVIFSWGAQNTPLLLAAGVVEAVENAFGSCDEDESPYFRKLYDRLVAQRDYYGLFNLFPWSSPSKMFYTQISSDYQHA